MKQLGELLKQKRIEANLSVEEVCEQTRLTQKHIKAIEEGNIEFFRDDLSYLRFFVKSYCEVVGCDFEEAKQLLRDGIDDYTKTMTLNSKQMHEQMEEHVNKSEKLTKVKKNETDQGVRQKVKKQWNRRVDFSFVSFVSVIVVIVIILGSALMMYMKSANHKDDSIKQPPIAQKEEKPSKENDKNKPSKKPSKTEETKKEMELTKVGLSQYQIENVKEGDELVFDIYFGGSSSGFSVDVDGAILADPASRIYQWKESAQAKVIAKKGMKITFYIGFFNQTQFKVNGVNVKIDDSLVTCNHSQNIEFTVMGDE